MAQHETMLIRRKHGFADRYTPVANCAVRTPTVADASAVDDIDRERERDGETLVVRETLADTLGVVNWDNAEKTAGFDRPIPCRYPTPIPLTSDTDDDGVCTLDEIDGDGDNDLDVDVEMTATGDAVGVCDGDVTAQATPSAHVLQPKGPALWHVAHDESHSLHTTPADPTSRNQPG